MWSPDSFVALRWMRRAHHPSLCVRCTFAAFPTWHIVVKAMTRTRRGVAKSKRQGVKQRSTLLPRTRSVSQAAYENMCGDHSDAAQPEELYRTALEVSKACVLVNKRVQ
eukprot:6100572-Amphidinium_carterae.1